MTTIRTLSLLLLSLSFLGCGSDPAPPPAATPAAVQQPLNDEQPDSLNMGGQDFGPLLALAKAIQADPANIESLLSDAGYDIDRFEKELLAIARDEQRSSAWVAQMN